MSAPTSWAWSFGDGGTSTSQNPSHTYTAPGVYTVTLVATNSAGSDTETKTGYVTVTVPEIAGVLAIAFDDPTLEPFPEWTRIDTLAGCRVRNWQVDRGRPTEFDKTDVGTASIRLVDREGLFDPTNTTSPYYGKVVPGKQAAVNLLNPVNDTWHTLFRGYVESWHYALGRTREHMELELQLVDGFAILARAELRVGVDGTLPLPDEIAAGNVGYGRTEGAGPGDPGPVSIRIESILADVGWPVELSVMWNEPTPGEVPDIFSGQVSVGPKAYGPGTSALDALWDCADADFPGVANMWMGGPGGGDGSPRAGHLIFRGRQARFRPDVVQYGIVRRTVGDPSAWDTGVFGPPLFSAEGPEFYAEAYAHNAPFATGGPYKTTLTGPQETAFLAWVTANSVPWANETPSDYDMRGFYKASVIDNTIPDWTPGGHFPDTYKTPYDTSFSNESQYATPDCPFEWVTDPAWGDLLIDTRDGQVVFGPAGAGVAVPVAELEWSNGNANLFNACSATPQGILPAAGPWRQLDPKKDNIAGQLVRADDPGLTGSAGFDAASIEHYGLRSLTFDNLQTLEGIATGNNSLQETKLFATYYVENYSTAPAPRISRMVFKSRRPDDAHGAALWQHMCNCEISDLLTLKTEHPGGGGFTSQEFYVEGIHYTGRPGGGDVPNIVELSLDVSPRAHWSSNPFDADEDPA